MMALKRFRKRWKAEKYYAESLRTLNGLPKCRNPLTYLT